MSNNTKETDLCAKCQNYFPDSQLINHSICYIPSCIIRGELSNIEYPLTKCKFFKRKYDK